MRLKRPIQTRFRYGSPTRVNLATHHNSQAHSSKGTQSHHPKGDAPTACRHTVSGTLSQPLTGALFTFPSRYSCTIGHQGVFRLTRWSWQIHTGFLEPRATRDTTKGVHPVSPTRLSRSTAPHPKGFDYQMNFSLPGRTAVLPQAAPTTPHTQHPPAITRIRFSLIRVRSPLLTESLLFSLPTGTEMFHFPALPPTALYIQTAATPHDWCQVSPFGHPRINVWLATPRGLTQPPTSFIGS
jgi:hypothetical protein